MTHILVNTGGGDAPGLNAVIRAIVLASIHRGWKVTGIKSGYDGILGDIPDGLIELNKSNIKGIANLGGSILGTKNTGHPFKYPVIENGETKLIDRSEELISKIKETHADALIAIGGDGSMSIAQALYERGIPVVGVPKTIDNDLNGTSITFGFDTAVSFATDAIDRLQTTAQSHQRVMVVEVMGRYAGWIALNSGIAGGADVILIPEIDFDIKKVCEKILRRENEGNHSSMVVVAEGAKPIGGNFTIQNQEAGREMKLGGIAEKVAFEINKITGKETRSIVLGHLQRGGSPTSFDRQISSRFGVAAVRLVEQKLFGRMVTLHTPNISSIPISEAIEKLKTVPLNSDTLSTARDLGINLGD